MGADEEGTLNSLKAHRRELIDPKIREHRGRIVKTTGDGMLVEFSSVVDAVRCAVEVQRGMVDRNAAIPEDQHITFRIGINLGDVIADDDDIYGDGVNIAARLEAIAEPGGVCISRTVRDHIGDRLPYTLEDIGEQSVKNIAQPVHAYALSAAAVASLPEVTIPLQSIGKKRRSNSSWLAALAACMIAVIAIGAAAWWGWPRGTLSTVSAPATVAAGAQKPPADELKTPARLSIVVLPFAKSQQRPRAAILRRWNHRECDDRSVADRAQFRDFTQYRVHLPEQAGRDEADRPRIGRALCVGRERAAVGKLGPNKRAAHRCRDRQAFMDGSV
jgi:adenylate cyclase